DLAIGQGLRGWSVKVGNARVHVRTDRRGAAAVAAVTGRAAVEEFVTTLAEGLFVARKRIFLVLLGARDGKVPHQPCRRRLARARGRRGPKPPGLNEEGKTRHQNQRGTCRGCEITHVYSQKATPMVIWNRVLTSSSLNVGRFFHCQFTPMRACSSMRRRYPTSTARAVSPVTGSPAR